jgi:hypothetical protein
MKKFSLGSILTAIILIIVGALFVYFYFSLNRLEKNLATTQATITKDSSQITAIVSFINTNANAKTTK